MSSPYIIMGLVWSAAIYGYTGIKIILAIALLLSVWAVIGYIKDKMGDRKA